MEPKDEARELPEFERGHKQFIKLLRERGPVPRPLSANKRRQVYQAISEQPLLLRFPSHLLTLIILDLAYVSQASLRQVDTAARLVARRFTLGHPPEALIATRAHALLREDAGFHAYQRC